jgi:hypothetical protein
MVEPMAVLMGERLVFVLVAERVDRWDFWKVE